MTDREAMKLALEALELYGNRHRSTYLLEGAWDKEITRGDQAITALKEALAQPEQEPDYKLLFGELAEKFALLLDEKKMWKKQALFCFDVTAPPQRTEQEPDELTIAYISGLYDGKKAQRTWVGLTDEEAEAIWEDHQFNGRPSEVSFANRMNLMQAIEAKLKQKNGFAEEKNT
jgi:hypothetical protein